MIDVLIVEDSLVAQEYLIQILSSDPLIRIVGTAKSGEEAIEKVKKYHPHVVTMDIELPKMNGFEATKAIMQAWPTRVIIVTALEAKLLDLTFKAMSAGAVALIEKPPAFGNENSEKKKKELIDTVKLMSEVPVVRHRMSNKTSNTSENPVKKNIKVLAIGASTGGPPILETILKGLPKNFPAPILIVQHITEGFIDGLAKWLSTSIEMPIHIATNGTFPLAGNVYLAPDHYHLVIGKNGCIELNNDPPDHNLKPSVEHLFQSVAKLFGNEAVGVLLTGMGRDGADGLKLMFEKGAITIAQDEQSSLVFGMPNEAIKTGGVTYVLPPEKIVEAILCIVSNTEGKL